MSLGHYLMYSSHQQCSQNCKKDHGIAQSHDFAHHVQFITHTRSQQSRFAGSSMKIMKTFESKCFECCTATLYVCLHLYLLGPHKENKPFKTRDYE